MKTGTSNYVNSKISKYKTYAMNLRNYPHILIMKYFLMDLQRTFSIKRNYGIMSIRSYFILYPLTMPLKLMYWLNLTIIIFNPI